MGRYPRLFEPIVLLYGAKGAKNHQNDKLNCSIKMVYQILEDEKELYSSGERYVAKPRLKEEERQGPSS